MQFATSLALRLKGAKQITKLTAISPLAGRARAGVAPGIVLLGDAAGFLDPITDTNPTLYLQRGRSFGTKELWPEWPEQNAGLRVRA